MVSVITRDSQYNDRIEIPITKFVSEYGFGKWHHYVITYLNDGVDTTDNIRLYADGRLRPEAELEATWTKQANFSATIELGNRSPYTGWAPGSFFHPKEK